MDSEALRAHKKTLRTELRARRAQRYGGEQGARRRELEAVRLLEHGRPLLGEIFGRAAADGSGDGPVVAAYHPTGTEADPRMLVREPDPRGAGPELAAGPRPGRAEILEAAGPGFRGPPGRRG